jgi:hypothetical protein
MGNQQPKVVGAPKIPRGLRRLPIASSTSSSSVRSEYDRLKAEAAQIEQWWSSPRWQDTKRVYSGTYVVLCCVVAVVLLLWLSRSESCSIL